MQDLVQHFAQSYGNVAVADPEHAVTLAFEELCAICVVLDGLQVLATIDLDDQPCFSADEIGEVRADSVLPAELEPGQASTT